MIDKKYVIAAIKVTVIALAASLLLSAVALVVALATDALGDKEAPVIRGPEGDTVQLALGDSVAYKSFVKVTDNRDKYDLQIKGKADTSKEGSYKITYIATDKAGNEAKYTLTVVVKKEAYSKAALMELVADKARQLGMNTSMSKTELVERIYNYVNDPTAHKDEANIRFVNNSNSARTDWENDWVEEAILTLSMDDMQGDCYTYYSVSLAFFEYFGIESIGIKRSEKADEPGTHFWSVVNVGSESNPKWYYYDATRLGGTYADGDRNGCLITEEKLNSYRTSDGGTQFYRFERPADFPRIETK